MSVPGADEGVEPAGSGTAADGGFEVVYVAADGTERRVSLAALSAVRLEDGRPVRSFPSYRGQRNYPAGTGQPQWAGGSDSNRGSSVITW